MVTDGIIGILKKDIMSEMNTNPRNTLKCPVSVSSFNGRSHSHSSKKLNIYSKKKVKSFFGLSFLNLYSPPRRLLRTVHHAP